MTARTHYVPLHSIIVSRDGKQVDALEQYKKDGKAFKFTAEEIKQIGELHNGDLGQALREPADEAVEEVAVDDYLATSDKPTNTEEAAEEQAAAEKAPPKPKANSAKAPKSKDDDL